MFTEKVNDESDFADDNDYQLMSSEEYNAEIIEDTNTNNMNNNNSNEPQERLDSSTTVYLDVDDDSSSQMKDNDFELVREDDENSIELVGKNDNEYDSTQFGLEEDIIEDSDVDKCIDGYEDDEDGEEEELLEEEKVNAELEVDDSESDDEEIIEDEEIVEVVMEEIIEIVVGGVIGIKENILLFNPLHHIVVSTKRQRNKPERYRGFGLNYFKI